MFKMKSNHYNWIIVTLLMLLANGINGQSPPAPVEGDPCITNGDCEDAKTFMECVQNECKCQNPAQTYFETVDGRCYLILNSECDYSTPDSIPCLFNGWCDPVIADPALCQCEWPHVETLGKNCAIPYDGECDNNLDCNREGFLLCLPGTPQKCGCDPTTSTYDPETQQCFLKLGITCPDPFNINSSQLCAPGSECKQAGDVFECQCIEGSSDNGQGQCRANIGEACSTNVRCNEAKWLTCENNVCACAFDMMDDGNGGCTGQIGAACDQGQPCDPRNFLVCKDNIRCDCKDGMAADSNGICKSMFEGSCASGEPCDESKFLTCDPKDQKCRCPIDETIDVGAGDCKALYQKPCDVAGLGAPDCDIASNLQCVAGKCECLPGSTPIGDGSCGAILYTPCSTDAECVRENFLKCGENKTCVCMEGFDPVGDECLAGFLTSCRATDVICNYEKFYDCDVDLKKCLCRVDLIDLGWGNCRALFDGPCETGQPLCDEYNFLVCDADTQKCQCREDLIPTPGGGCRARSPILNFSRQ